MSKTILSVSLVVVVSLIVAEVVARFIFGLAPLEMQNPYQPVFALAERDQSSPSTDIAAGASGPGGYGYEHGTFGYYYTGRTPLPRSSTALADFLFDHRLSRYSAEKIDAIACAQPRSLGVFVLGASVAQGHSARSKEATWHALLEGRLRQALGRDDVYLFNGAMGGYLSLQDKLAYHMAVAPRQARVVLFLNSWNDLLLPAYSATRPGDPFVLGVRFEQTFSDGFLFWLAKHSGIVNTLVQNEAKSAVQTYARRLAHDDGFFNRYADKVTDIYLQNMSDVLTDCQMHGRFCLVAIPPTRPLAALDIGRPAGEIVPDRRVAALFELLMKKIDASPFRAQFADLTHLFDAPDLIEHFTDSVHIDEAGQKILADRLFEPMLNGLRTVEELHSTWMPSDGKSCR
ncbi:MAG: SGNH/GDSL hydrolase family protein [Alphaproteobacteria bacterium]|nr:SGNH/GDSL hydrolase family protein [Alphaproteobacteria bacterium]MBV8409792.1 SGNH/GDSL hydrolase family protein [Alphaproteobacteria bacterium]